MNKTINIHQYLPHQEPMLMVDWIKEITADGVVCVFEIKSENIFVENGFFNEAGLIENAAQSCSSIVAQNFFSDNSEETHVIGFISSIRKVNVFQRPMVGSIIITYAKLLARTDMGDFKTCRVECKTFDKDTLILEGELNLFIQEQAYEKGRSTSR